MILTKSFNPQKIDTIIFDFGGVLLDIDYEATFRAMSMLLGFSEDEPLPYHLWTNTLNKYEVGQLSTENFIFFWQTKTKLKKTPQAREIIDAWNAMLNYWPQGYFELLLLLRKKYKIFLLSNTNDLHIQWVKNHLSKRGLDPHFEKRYFDGTYYSHNVALRKPNTLIYEYVSHNACLNPSSIVFIDDNSENIDAAITFGWNGILHPTNTPLDVTLKKYGLLL